MSESIPVELTDTARAQLDSLPDDHRAEVVEALRGDPLGRSVLMRVRDQPIRPLFYLATARYGIFLTKQTDSIVVLTITLRPDVSRVES